MFCTKVNCHYMGNSRKGPYTSIKRFSFTYQAVVLQLKNFTLFVVVYLALDILYQITDVKSHTPVSPMFGDQILTPQSVSLAPQTYNIITRQLTYTTASPPWHCHSHTHIAVTITLTTSTATYGAETTHQHQILMSAL